MTNSIETRGISKINRDLDLILRLFTEMLDELGEKYIAEHLSQMSIPANLSEDAEQERKLIRAIGMIFQLMNLVEENAAVQYRRAVESETGMSAIRGSWAETFSSWKAEGISEKEIAELLNQVHVQPVLTAHPTEAKRVSILDIHRELYLLLFKMESNVWTPSERLQIQ